MSDIIQALSATPEKNWNVTTLESPTAPHHFLRLRLKLLHLTQIRQTAFRQNASPKSVHANGLQYTVWYPFGNPPHPLGYNHFFMSTLLYVSWWGWLLWALNWKNKCGISKGAAVCLKEAKRAIEPGEGAGNFWGEHSGTHSKHFSRCVAMFSAPLMTSG